MATDTENCPFCETENSYKSTHCVSCREELPWANWVKAAQKPSEALGAQAKHYIRPGEGQLAVSGGLAAGLRYKIWAIVLPLVLMLGIAYFAVKQFSGGNASVVEQFKNANPTVKQEESLRKDGN